MRGWRRLVILNACASELQSRRAVSEVIDSALATPRTPSVPNNLGRELFNSFLRLEQARTYRLGHLAQFRLILPPRLLTSIAPPHPSFNYRDSSTTPGIGQPPPLIPIPTIPLFPF